MKLRLLRTFLNDTCTIGELYADDVMLCFTLELPVRDGLPGSAIPTGIFPVNNRVSPRFGRNVPHIEPIPNRSSILIHWGNTASNTDGCVLVGKTHNLDNPCFIGESRKAFDELYALFTAALSRGEDVTIEVQGGQRSTNQSAVAAAARGDPEGGET